MSNRNQLLALFAVAVIPAALAGCQQLQCAPGTSEQNGECQPANGQFDNGTCGPGTVLDNGMCVPEIPPTECDPNTTTPEPCQDDPSITCCVGTGGGGCSTDLACPAAVGGKVTLCGRLYDLETNQQLQALTPTQMQCGNGGASDGPCQLNVEVYDAIDFANNPGGATPLNHMPLYLDDCGRYKIEGISPPGTTFMGIGVDDASGQSDTHKLTGVAVPANANQTINRFATYSETTQTDTDWSSQAGLNPSFASRGVYVGIFLHKTSPVAGVTLTVSGSTDPTNDYYFSDQSADTRTTIDVNQAVTGMDGTGLMINVPGLAQMSGTGMEDNGCMWPSDQGASLPGVVFVQQRVEKESGSTVDCP